MIRTEFSAMGASIVRAAKCAIFLLATAITASVSVTEAQTTPGPRVFFTDLTSGPNSGGESVSGFAGAYVTIYGNNFGSTQGASTVTWNGQNCLRVVIWAQPYLWYQKMTVQLGSSCTPGTGNFVVTVNGQNSTAVTEKTSGGTQTPSQFTVRSTGTIHCVSTGGSDSNPGTFSGGCWQTIVKGRQILPGDITYVENGVSQTGTDGFASVTLNGTGSAANPLALVVYPGGTATIGATTGNDGVRFCNGYSACSNGGSYWTIAGFNLRGANSAIGISSGVTNVRFVANNLSCPNGAGETACATANGPSVGFIYFYGNNTHDSGTSNATKTYHSVYWSTDVNDIWDAWNSTSGGGACRGLQFYSTGGSDQFDLHVHDNLFFNIRCDAVNFSTVNPDAGPVEAYNNVLYNVGIGPDPSDGSSVYTCFNLSAISAHTNSVKIYNNTCMNAGFSGGGGNDKGAFNPSVPTLLTNNLVIQNTGQPYFDPNSGCVHVTSGNNNNFFGNGGVPSCSGMSANLSVDPLIVNASAPNLNLLSNSPMIGAGAATLFSTFDHDGLIRPQPPSIGAHEFADGSVTLPSPPTNLAIVVS